MGKDMTIMCGGEQFSLFGGSIAKGFRSAALLLVAAYAFAADSGSLQVRIYDTGGKTLTVRQRIEAHRRDEICASCHAKLDPYGLALENYDAVGQWRASDAAGPIDASGTLPDGTRFDGPAGLTTLLLTKYRDDFVRTATEKLLTYALGRGVEYYDAPTIRSIGRDAARDNYRISSLILAVVRSAPFQMRRASDP